MQLIEHEQHWCIGNLSMPERRTVHNALVWWVHQNCPDEDDPTTTAQPDAPPENYGVLDMLSETYQVNTAFIDPLSLEDVREVARLLKDYRNRLVGVASSSWDQRDNEEWPIGVGTLAADRALLAAELAGSLSVDIMCAAINVRPAQQ